MRTDDASTANEVDKLLVLDPRGAINLAILLERNEKNGHSTASFNNIFDVLVVAENIQGFDVFQSSSFKKYSTSWYMFFKNSNGEKINYKSLKDKNYIGDKKYKLSRGGDQENEICTIGLEATKL